MQSLLTWGEQVKAPASAWRSPNRAMRSRSSRASISSGCPCPWDSIFITDLRLMGLLFRNVPVSDVLHHLRPWILAGFAGCSSRAACSSGLEASTVMASPAFPVKMLFILLAGLNAAYFEFITAKKAPVAENHRVLPASVKFAGAASLTLWTLVVIFGRLHPLHAG